MPVTMVATTANSNTLASNPASRIRGIVPALVTETSFTPAQAKTPPRSAPAQDSVSPSTRNCRTRCGAAAPIAFLTATSRRRESDRARRRLATLTHAISKKNATAPSNIRMAVLALPMVSSWKLYMESGCCLGSMVW
jgi:hypothetical protein